MYSTVAGGRSEALPIGWERGEPWGACGRRERVNILTSVAVFVVLAGSARDSCLSNETHTRIAIGQKSAESVLYCSTAVLYRSVYSSIMAT